MNPVMTTLDDLPDGAVLAEALCESSGQVLLAAGSVLTGPVIASLRRRGVEHVKVTLPEPAADPAPPEDPRVQRERIERRVQHLFRLALRNGQIHPLMHMMPAYRLGEDA